MHEFDYCERLDASFWAEPFNALSNVFFLIAAYAALRFLSRHPLDRQSYYLALSQVITLFIIGIGSFLWHTVATPWAKLADVIPISIFMHLYIFLFIRYVAGWKPTPALLFLILFIAVNYLFGAYIDATVLNGSITYIPALLFLAIMNVLIRKSILFKQLLGATLLFVLSLTFRTVDFAVCDLLSTGTHAVWHALNATLLWMLIRLFIQSRLNPKV